ncbi:hypothetical protein BKA80DRAFT_85550 [Phyllosticta citrichinensis]
MDTLLRVSIASLDTMPRPTLPTTSHPSTRNGRPSGNKIPPSSQPKQLLIHSRCSKICCSTRPVWPRASSPLLSWVAKGQLLTTSIHFLRLKLAYDLARVAASNLLFWTQPCSLSSPLPHAVHPTTAVGYWPGQANVRLIDSGTTFELVFALHCSQTTAHQSTRAHCHCGLPVCLCPTSLPTPGEARRPRTPALHMHAAQALT